MKGELSTYQSQPVLGHVSAYNLARLYNLDYVEIGEISGTLISLLHRQVHIQHYGLGPNTQSPTLPLKMDDRYRSSPSCYTRFDTLLLLNPLLNNPLFDLSGLHDSTLMYHHLISL
jgi:hypothetical protein